MKPPVLHSNGARLGTRVPAILTLVIMLTISMFAAATSDARSRNTNNHNSITTAKKSKKAGKKAKKNRRVRKSSVASVSTVSPANGATISGKVKWEAKAAATSGDKITMVRFYINGTKYWTDYASPYVFNGDGNTFDTTQAPNGSYALKSEAVSRSGNVKSSSITVKIANGVTPPPPPPPNPAPTAVSNLHAVSGTTTTSTVAWNASAGAVSYDVLVDGVFALNTAATSATVPTPCGTFVTITVVAKNSTGSAAAIVTGTTISCPSIPTAPAAPTGLQVTGGTTTSTTLGWNASSGATSYDVLVGGVVRTNVTGTSATVSTTCGTSTSFSVVAKNSTGSNASSLTATTTTCPVVPPPPTAPAAPTGLQVTGGTTTSTTLGWNASSGATSYDVLVGGSVVTNVTGTSATVNTTCGTSTSFVVVAKNSAGSNSSSLTATTTTCPVIPPPSGDLTATTQDFSHVDLAWPAVSGTSTYTIMRDGKQLATRASSVRSYEDSQLWYSTSYSYTVVAKNSSGSTIDTLGPASATTHALPSSGFPVDFKSGGLWTTPLGSAPPIHPRNSQFMSYVNSHLNSPNMPMRAYGIPFYEAEPNDPKYGPFSCIYACNVNSFVPVPIPQDADVDPGTDRHMTVYDRNAGKAYDYYKPVQNSSGMWTSTSAGAVIPFSGNGIVPKNLAGSNAANFAAMAGIIYPEELAQGRIDHAVQLGIPGIAGGAPACPATHNVGTTSDPNALPEGALLQLDPSINVDALSIPNWQKAIARAMQTYGGYVRDNSGTFAVYAETSSSVLGGRGYDGWSKTGLGLSTGSSQSFSSSFPWNRMRVIDFEYGPDC